MLRKSPQTDFIRCSIPKETNFKKDVFEHSKLCNSGESEDIDPRSIDTIQLYNDISKTRLGAVNDAVKLETHLNSNTKGRDPICELKITRVHTGTILPEEIPLNFCKILHKTLWSSE